MGSIEVLSRTQRIVVHADRSISVVNAGPVGPSGFGVHSIVEGDHIDVDGTDPNNPIISVTPDSFDEFGTASDLVAAEQLARETADQNLESALGAEIDNRTEADEDIVAWATTQIQEAVDASSAADSVLSDAIEQEEQDRIDGDETLAAGIASEAGARIAADGVLNDAIEAEEQARIADVEQEAADRAAADALLIPISDKGAPEGVAELDENGFIYASQLPSYVDDMLEFDSIVDFPLVGETGKMYVDKTSNLTYRWSGSVYAPLDPSLALGETPSTAYRGDRGKTAYDHSQITSGNPHGTTKAHVGLGQVDNTSDADKPISTATDAALDAMAAAFQSADDLLEDAIEDGDDAVAAGALASDLQHYNLVTAETETKFVTERTRLTALEAHETLAISGDPQKALARWRMGLAQARGGVTGAFATQCWYGDSIVEGFWANNIINRASNIVRRRLAYRSAKAGTDIGNAEWLPAVSGNGAGVNWPGPAGAGVDPWTRTGTTTNVDGALGPGLTCVNLSAGAKMSAPFVGDTVLVVYTRSPNTVAGNVVNVKIDGVLQGTIAPNGADLFGAISTAYTAPGGYGLHTIEVEYTGAGGFFVFEGIYVFQNVSGNGIAIYNYGNGGSAAAGWATAATGAWENVLFTNQPQVVVWNLGTNDKAFGVSPAAFEASFKTIVDKIEAKLTAQQTPKVGYVFLLWPSYNITPRADWWQALKNVAAYVPNDRGLAIDLLPELADVVPNAGTYPRTTLLSDGVHPNTDVGQFWFADIMSRLFDPSPPPARIHHTQLIGTTAGTTVNVYHGLASKRVKASFSREATGEDVIIGYTRPSADYITVDFDTYVRTANEFRVTVTPG